VRTTDRKSILGGVLPGRQGSICDGDEVKHHVLTARRMPAGPVKRLPAGRRPFFAQQLILVKEVEDKASEIEALPNSGYRKQPPADGRTPH
jgi:hypothetical protein